MKFGDGGGGDIGILSDDTSTPRLQGQHKMIQATHIHNSVPSTTCDLACCKTCSFHTPVGLDNCIEQAHRLNSTLPAAAAAAAAATHSHPHAHVATSRLGLCSGGGWITLVPSRDHGVLQRVSVSRLPRWKLDRRFADQRDQVAVEES